MTACTPIQHHDEHKHYDKVDMWAKERMKSWCGHVVKKRQVQGCPSASHVLRTLLWSQA